jgi:hypothetical protein
VGVKVPVPTIEVGVALMVAVMVGVPLQFTTTELLQARVPRSVDMELLLVWVPLAEGQLGEPTQVKLPELLFQVGTCQESKLPAWVTPAVAVT